MADTTTETATLKPRMAEMLAQVTNGLPRMAVDVHPLNVPDDDGRALYRLEWLDFASGDAEAVTFEGNYTEVYRRLEAWSMLPACVRANREANLLKLRATLRENFDAFMKTAEALGALTGETAKRVIIDTFGELTE